MIISVHFCFFTKKELYLDSFYYICNKNIFSSRRFIEQCRMTLLETHKLCDVLHNAHKWHNILRQSGNKPVSGSQENVYI